MGRIKEIINRATNNKSVYLSTNLRLGDNDYKSDLQTMAKQGVFYTMGTTVKCTVDEYIIRYD